MTDQPIRHFANASPGGSQETCESAPKKKYLYEITLTSGNKVQGTAMSFPNAGERLPFMTIWHDNEEYTMYQAADVKRITRKLTPDLAGGTLDTPA